MPAGQINAAKTHCPKGHEYTEENTAYRVEGNTTKRWCRECSRANGRVQRLKNYNMTHADFDNMLAAQDGVCKICRSDFKSTRDQNIDHDHNCCAYDGSCGECVRGILCGECNRGLARFRESADLLERAMHYVRAVGNI